MDEALPISNSKKIPYSQTAWMQALTAPLYSASAEERKMEAYFLLDQKIGSLPNIKTYMEVDFWSIR